MPSWLRKFLDIKMSDSKYVHIPVLLTESVDSLVSNPDGVYVDVTYGGGGHSRAILDKLNPGGRIFGFDQDEMAIKNKIEDNRLTLVWSNFRYLKKYLRYYKVEKVDGILADLGVSSFHFDTDDRGFSFQSDYPLDMRMNQEQELNAEGLLQTYSEVRLAKVFTQYGELTNGHLIAKKWIQDRKSTRLNGCASFAEWVSPFVYGKRNKFLAQLFQALRIEVNQELESLGEFLMQASDLLKPGGRLVVISYHSLEDRMVKNFIKTGLLDLENDYSLNRHKKTMKQLSKNVIVPSENELERNSRSRSAKMRVGIRLND